MGEVAYHWVGHMGACVIFLALSVGYFGLEIALVNGFWCIVYGQVGKWASISTIYLNSHLTCPLLSSWNLATALMQQVGIKAPVPCHTHYSRGQKTKLLPPGINIILHVRPDDILGRGLLLTAHTRALVQEAPLGLAMREHGHAALDRLHGIRVEDALARRGQEEGRLARRELVVEVDQEGEEGRLLCVGQARVVLVGVVGEDA